MGKLVHILAMLCLIMLVIMSAFWPHGPLMYLAGDSVPINIVRVVLIAVLSVEIVTNPPRALAWRVVAATIAITICAEASYQTYQDHMQLLDGLSLAAASVSMLISAMDLRFEIPEVDIEALRRAKRGILLDSYSLRGGFRE